MKTEQIERTRRVLDGHGGDVVQDVAVLCCAARQLLDEREAMLTTVRDALAQLEKYGERTGDVERDLEAAIAKAES